MTTRGNGNYGEDAILDWRCVWEARFHYLLDIITIYIYAVCIVGLRDVLISFYLFFFSFHCASSSAVIQLYVRLGTIGKGKKKKGSVTISRTLLSREDRVWRGCPAVAVAA